MTYFDEEKKRIEAAETWIAEAGVAFGEFSSENVLGDPHLRDAVRLAAATNAALHAAAELATQTLAAIDTAEEQEGAAAG
jgi:hypothetical protein